MLLANRTVAQLTLLQPFRFDRTTLGQNAPRDNVQLDQQEQDATAKNTYAGVAQCFFPIWRRSYVDLQKHQTDHQAKQSHLAHTEYVRKGTQFHWAQ